MPDHILLPFCPSDLNPYTHADADADTHTHTHTHTHPPNKHNILVKNNSLPKCKQNKNVIVLPLSLLERSEDKNILHIIKPTIIAA